MPFQLCVLFSVVDNDGKVVPGGEDLQEGKGYRLRFDREISVKLPSNVYVFTICHSHASRFSARICSLQHRYAVTCSALGFENLEPKLFRCVGMRCARDD
jgi:hypothetical protein